MSGLGGAAPRRGTSPRVDVDGIEVVLRGLRERWGVTQKEIADRAEVSPATIARLEAGDRRPSRDILARLAAVFATTPEALVEAARWVSGQLSVRRDGMDDELRSELDELLSSLPPAPPSAPPSATSAGIAASAAARAFDAEVTDPAGSMAAADPFAAWPQPQPPPPPGSLSADPSASSPVARQVGVAFELLVGAPDPQRASAVLLQVASWLPRVATSDLDAIEEQLTALVSGRDDDTVPVAAMPTGEVRSVPVAAVAHDAQGRWWIDPLARARTGGDDTREVRVERYDDGRIVVDVSRLGAEVAPGGRDPEQHRTRVRLAPGTGAPVGVDAQAYTEVVLELTWPDGTRSTVEPAATPTTDGTLPDGTGEVVVLTAANPRGRLLGASENTERTRLLAAELDAASLSWLPAVVRAATGAWAEDAVAVVDADLDQLRALAGRYEQTCLYRWTPTELQVVWTDPDHPPLTSGWHATTSAPADRPAS